MLAMRGLRRKEGPLSDVLSKISFLHSWQKGRNRVIFNIYCPFYKEFSFKSERALKESEFLEKNNYLLV